MTPDAIPDAAVEAASGKFGTKYYLVRDVMRAALAAALPHMVAERDARIKTLEEALTATTKALLPLTKGIFNDNGDISVSFPSMTYDDCVAAYFAERKARAALEKPHE